MSFEPTICKNVLDLTPEDIIDKLLKFSNGINVIWASPPCTQYSKARTQGGPRDLDGSDKIVQKVLDLAKYLVVPFCMENPQTGLLENQDVVKGIPVRVIDYCSYADEAFPGRYRKRTGIWTNTNWMPARAICKPSLCKFCSDGTKTRSCSPTESKNRTNAMEYNKFIYIYIVPPALPHELIDYISG